MKIRSASVDELLLGARMEHDDGRLCHWRFRIVDWAYRAALTIMRKVLSCASS
jgi:hypothetical protein